MDRQDRQALTARNPGSDSSAVALDDAAAGDVSREVLRLVQAAFDPRGGRSPDRSRGRAFVVEVLRLARHHGVDLSEAELAEVFEAALKIDVADQVATWLGDALGESLRDSFEAVARPAAGTEIGGGLPTV